MSIRRKNNQVKNLLLQVHQTQTIPKLAAALQLNKECLINLSV